MRFTRRGWALLLGAALVLSGATGAQAVSVDVVQMKNMKVTESEDTIVLKSRGNKRGVAVVEVDVAPGEGANADIFIKKLNGKKRGFEMAFDGDETLVFKKTKRAVVKFKDKTPVPEPTTAAMLGLGLAGLAYVGRRRRS